MRHLLLALALPLFLHLTACVTASQRLEPGIQPAYGALNPSRTLAVTPIVFANPIARRSVDLAEISSQKLAPLLETLVLTRFKDQSGVNGVSFQAVREASALPPPSPLVSLAAAAHTAAQERADGANTRGQVSPACRDARNLLEFYAACLSTRASWLKPLNELSSRVFNADTALLVFLTNLEKRQQSGRPSNLAQLAVLVVDTNSGKLIWGREAEAEQLGVPGGAFPAWKPIFEDLLGEPFWAQFPGRRGPAAELPSENPTP